MTPTDYSIYCPEANQKKIVAEWFERMGYERSAGYTDHSNANYPYMTSYSDFPKMYSDFSRKNWKKSQLTFSEWQSMVEEVPPGILEMQTKSGDKRTYAQNHNDYDEWYKKYSELGFFPTIISVEGVTWEVGEETQNTLPIKSFHYIDGEWRYLSGNNMTYGLVKYLTKKLPSERKILRYKLIKKYPGSSEVGSQHYPDGTNYHDDTEFWQPIYSEPRTPVVELPDEMQDLIDHLKENYRLVKK